MPTLTGDELTVYLKLFQGRSNEYVISRLIFLGHSSRNNTVAKCQHACEDLSPSFLYTDFQQSHIHLFGVCHRHRELGIQIVHCANFIPCLPAFCIQLEQDHYKGLLRKFKGILSVDRNH